MSARPKPKKAEKLADGVVTRSLERRREIVRAAYETIAERGFEGLRMREVANRAGMNHATLHYYFAGKEALIDGVLHYIVEELSIGHDASAKTEACSPRQRIADYFSRILRQMRDQPEMFIVLTEINARSLRDSRLRSVMARHDRGWNRFLSAVLKEGIQKKEFQAALDPDVFAKVIISFLRGLYLTYAGRAEDLERAVHSFMRILS